MALVWREEVGAGIIRLANWFRGLSLEERNVLRYECEKEAASSTDLRFGNGTWQERVARAERWREIGRLFSE